jgi:hypothetical protein
MDADAPARASLVERGLAQRRDEQAYRDNLLASGIAQAKKDLRRSFVFRFYHDTMTDTHRSAVYHRFGPDSPDPLIEPVAEPGWMGGQYRYVPWEWEWDGLRWRAEWDYRHGGWDLTFYVWAKIDRERQPRRLRDRWLRRLRIALGGKEWREVNSPGSIADLVA